jgi:hypothetical protein
MADLGAWTSIVECIPAYPADISTLAVQKTQPLSAKGSSYRTRDHDPQWPAFWIPATDSNL